VTHVTSRIEHRAYLLVWKKDQCSLLDLHKPLIEWLPDKSWSIEIVLVMPPQIICHIDFKPFNLKGRAYFSLANKGEKAWNFWKLLQRVVAFIHSHFVENVEQTSRFFYLNAEICPSNISSFNEVITLLFLLNVVTLGHILYHLYHFKLFSITESIYKYLGS